MSVKVVNSGSGTIKVSAETTPAIKVESPEVGVVNVNPVYTSGQPGPTGPAGADGQGVAAGGDTGQFLVKTSDSDYATGWAFPERVLLEVRFDEAVSKGDPLYVTGYNIGQNRITVAKADASDSSKMPSFGLAYDAYSQSDNGQAIAIGSLDDVNTQNAPNDFQEGDVLYVKAGGGLTNTKPSGTNLIQNVGKVGRRQQNNGEIVVMAIGRSNDVPNIPDGQVWIGNSSGVATPTALSSLVIDSLVVKNDGQTQTITDGDATINFVEGSGINVSVTDGGSAEIDVNISGEDAAYLNKGVAQFDSDDFTVTDGSVSLINGLGTVLYDKSPQLGGDLDVNGNEIVSTNSEDITIRPDGTGVVRLGNYAFDVDQVITASEDDYVLTYDHSSRTISLEQAGGSGETYTITAEDGDNADEEKIVLTDSQSVTDEVVLEAGTGLSVSRDGDKITFTNTVTDTNTSLSDTDQTLDADRDIDIDGNSLSVVDGASNIATFSNSGLVTVNGAFIPGQYNTTGSTTGLTSAGDFAAGCEVLTKFGTTTATVAGDVYYYEGSWTQADSDTVASASKLLAVASGASTTSPLVARGLIRMADNTGFSSASSGDVLYLNPTAGHVGTNAPTSGVVRVVGYVVDNSNGLIYFDPSKDWIEL